MCLVIHPLRLFRADLQLSSYILDISVHLKSTLLVSNIQDHLVLPRIFNMLCHLVHQRRGSVLLSLRV